MQLAIKFYFSLYLLSEIQNGSVKIREESIERMRISPPKLTSGVPGYYWQHISYVVVWWFMAGLVMWMPFYRRRETQI
jgi:hypothetical protein